MSPCWSAIRPDERIAYPGAREEPALRVLLIGPPSPHLIRWRALVEELGWEVAVVSYGGALPGAAAVLDEVAGGRLATAAALARDVVRLRRAVRMVRPDVVHAHWLTGPAWIAAAAGLRQPLVVSAWGSDVLVWTPRSRFARLLARLVARRADVTTYDAEVVADALVTAGFPRNRLARVVFGPDERRFRPAEPDRALLARLGVTEVPVVLAPRGLAPVYRPETVVAGVAAAGTDATLLLRVASADDARLPPLLDLGRRLGLTRLVPFPGVDEEELPALLASVDAVVSVPESDGSSVVVLETLMSGTPVIASDLPANREWIAPDTGWLVPAGDAAALAGALGRVLGNPDVARAHARKLGETVARTASRGVQADAVKAAYERGNTTRARER